MYRILGVDGREYGPVSAEQLRRWVAEGRANAETKARAEGTDGWKSLSQFPEFSLLFPSNATSSPPLYVPIRKTNSLAVTGLVFGILSITGGLCCYGLPFNILGVVFSIIALTQIHSQPEVYEGKGMAIAGLVLSLLGILVMLGLIGFIALSSTWHEPVHHFRRL